ncbi:DinB family protein [bacterium LRH843]|nr:DinB family protein [bacterium LRH843]
MSYSPFAFARTAIMNVLESASTEQVDAIPDGFNNSIRWNAGHTLVIAEKVLSHSEHYEHVLPEHYKAFFDKGTSPRDWTDHAPSASEIADYSTKQLQSAKKLFDEHADLPLANAFNLRGNIFSTVPDLLSFLSYHEGLHYGAIKLLNK